MEMPKRSEVNSYPKKDRRSLSRCSNLKNPSTAMAAIQAIAHAKGMKLVTNGNGREDDAGGVQVKFVISKKELKQMMASMGWSSKSNQKPNVVKLEQTMEMLKKRHMKRRVEFADGDQSIRWEPVLQSIPEEL